MTNPSPLIMAVAVLLGSIVTLLVPDTPKGDPRGVSEIAEPMYSTALNTKTIRLADNKNSTPNSNQTSQPASDNETVQSVSESRPGKSVPSTKAKSKPLKPFVPSEKIAAEQAVDFPVDI